MSITNPTGALPWISISNAPAHAGGTVELRGWLTHRRSSGKVQFLVLRDGTGVMQCVAGVKDITPEEWQACEHLTQESAVVVRGSLRLDARAPGGVEMGLQSVRVVSVGDVECLRVVDGQGRLLTRRTRR